MNQRPDIDFDDPEYIWPLMPPLPPPITPAETHPYKGKNGKLYDKESDALRTYGCQNGTPRWVLTSGFFDPPHYMLIEITSQELSQ